ncbi:MAG: T9SS C-terminal target domain-containing protein [Bacteroidetes bacterium]|nr:MAG: T9SS C-terminal target domain-containing protein [Bacteroidota bacterium]REK00033.1 MAG: T9SS C-terminal target domain-containing protein [Bacteroidota bacterium]REK35786.1 MAG: T9SS C-terminal target domain-containing protein [Bacteroidota bacterium]REK49341.1 MAG: T9SS C-terminal target domain-containing protein [Bacteroidota bacterium]
MNLFARHFILHLLIIFSTGNAFAQSTLHKYFISFTDKNGSTFSVSNPSEFLSQRAIQRRANQGIQISSEDLPVNSNYADALTSAGARLLGTSKWFNGAAVECDSSTLISIQSLPFVSGSRIVRGPVKKEREQAKFRSDLNSVLNEPSILRVQGFDYGQSFNQIHLMNGEYLHNQGFTGNGMLIALLDAGYFNVDQLNAFDTLRMLGNIVATWDFVEGNDSVYEDDAHGTQVLSCIAGNVPGQLVGTAPHASFLLLRSEDAPTEYIVEEYYWAFAAEYADSAGADIISSSLGYTTFDDSTMNHTYLDMDGNTAPSTIAADKAASKGILVISSAGNSGNNPWRYIGAPADGDSVLAIGAVNQFGVKAGFSSWGPSSDGDVKPNVAAKGEQTTIAWPNGFVGTGNGTSFACPVLAGAAACLWQAHPGKTNMEIFRAIEQSANYYQNPGDSLGYGIPNFITADILLGGGTLNLPGEDLLHSVYPNPFSSRIEIRFYSFSHQNLIVELIDALGRNIMRESVKAEAGIVNQISINPPADLNKGIYFIRIESKGKLYTRRIMKI